MYGAQLAGSRSEWERPDLRPLTPWLPSPDPPPRLPALRRVVADPCEALLSATSNGCIDKKGCSSGCNPLRHELRHPLGARRPKRRPVNRESKKLRPAPDARQGWVCWCPTAWLQSDCSARRRPVSCSDSHQMTAASPARDHYARSERGNAKTMSSSFTSSWEPCDSLLLEEQ